MFAQLYHASMKYAAPVCREMGVRTVFNILGPLSNPAGATMQLMGVYDPRLVKPLARVLANLGVTRGLAVSGTAINTPAISSPPTTKPSVAISAISAVSISIICIALIAAHPPRER